MAGVANWNGVGLGASNWVIATIASSILQWHNAHTLSEFQPITFRVEGVPVAQPRHRASFRGGFAKMYIPKDHAIHHWKNLIARQAFEQVENVLEHAVKVDVLFVFKARRKTEIGNFKTSKPDIDNLLKAALDALTDAGMWSDDSQVVQVNAAKMYGITPYMEISIQPVDFSVEQRKKPIGKIKTENQS